jgi:hypothetical protein
MVAATRLNKRASWIGLHGQFGGEEDLGVRDIGLLAGTCTFCVCIFVSPFVVLRAVSHFIGTVLFSRLISVCNWFVCGVIGDCSVFGGRFVFCVRFGRAFVGEGWRRLVAAWDILARLA